MSIGSVVLEIEAAEQLIRRVPSDFPIPPAGPWPEDIFILTAVLLGKAERHSRQTGGGLALVVDGDVDRRARRVAVLTGLAFTTIECACAEAALALLMRRANEIAVAAVDFSLSGPRDGIALARIINSLWPTLRVVLGAIDAPELQPNVIAHAPVNLETVLAAEAARARLGGRDLAKAV